MTKSEIFYKILDKVCYECQVHAEDILTGVKDQTIVDARTLLIQYARRVGLSSSEIAAIVVCHTSGRPIIFEPSPEVRKKAKVVDKIFRAYGDRCMQSKAFCIQSREINEFMDDEFMTNFVR